MTDIPDNKVDILLTTGFLAEAVWLHFQTHPAQGVTTVLLLVVAVFRSISAYNKMKIRKTESLIKDEQLKQAKILTRQKEEDLNATGLLIKARLAELDLLKKGKKDD